MPSKEYGLLSERLAELEKRRTDPALKEEVDRLRGVLMGCQEQSEKTSKELSMVKQDRDNLAVKAAQLEQDKVDLLAEAKRFEKYAGIEQSLKEIIVPFVEETMAKHISALPGTPAIAASGGVTSQGASDAVAKGLEGIMTLEQRQMTLRVEQKPVDLGKIDDSTLRGKILLLAPAEGKWFFAKDILEQIAEGKYGEDVYDAALSEELNKMHDEGLLAKRKNANRTVQFRLPDNVTLVR